MSADEEVASDVPPRLVCVHIPNYHRSNCHGRPGRSHQFHGQTASTESKNVYLPFHHPQKRFAPPFAPPFANGQINLVSSARFKNYTNVCRYLKTSELFFEGSECFPGIGFPTENFATSQRMSGCNLFLKSSIIQIKVA